MRSIYHAFLLLLAKCTNSELAQLLEFQKAEIRVLRTRIPGPVTVTPAERQRLLKLGRELGPKVKDILSIVTYRTYQRWLQADKQAKRQKPMKPGRPPVPEDICMLVLRLARENPEWGYTRILGELRKLGLAKRVGRSTIKKLLRDNGIDPGPKRGQGSWSEFIKIHTSTLWATDFFSVKTWTTAGLVDMYVLLFLHIDSRRVEIAGITAHPDGAWMAQQARNFCILTAEHGDPAYLIRDMDTKFTKEFDAILEAEGVDVVRVGPRKPNLNAFCERVVQSIKSECLSHFIVFGEKHLRYLLKTYLKYYHGHRPYQSKENMPLSGMAISPSEVGEVVCEEFLGGLLKHYSRRAA